MSVTDLATARRTMTSMTVDTWEALKTPKGKDWTIFKHRSAGLRELTPTSLVLHPLSDLGPAEWFKGDEVGDYYARRHKEGSLALSGAKEMFLMLEHRQLISDVFRELVKKPVLTGVGRPGDGTPFLAFRATEYIAKREEKVFPFIHQNPHGDWECNYLAVNSSLHKSMFTVCWRM